MNPKDKIGMTKANLALIPPVANIYEAKVMEHGAAKYGAYNWRDNKVQVMVYISAMLRHLSAYLDGQDVDPDSGNFHLAHIRANTGILLDAIENDSAIDNRPKAGNAAKVLANQQIAPGNSGTFIKYYGGVKTSDAAEDIRRGILKDFGPRNCS